MDKQFLSYICITKYNKKIKIDVCCGLDKWFLNIQIKYFYTKYCENITSLICILYQLKWYNKSLKISLKIRDSDILECHTYKYLVKNTNLLK